MVQSASSVWSALRTALKERFEKLQFICSDNKNRQDDSLSQIPILDCSYII